MASVDNGEEFACVAGGFDRVLGPIIHKRSSGLAALYVLKVRANRVVLLCLKLSKEVMMIEAEHAVRVGDVEKAIANLERNFARKIRTRIRRLGEKTSRGGTNAKDQADSSFAREGRRHSCRK